MSTIGVKGFVITQLRLRIKNVKATVAKKQKKLAAMESELAQLTKKRSKR